MNVANVIRYALGLSYLAAAVFNLIFTRRNALSNPQLYAQWVENPLLPFYRWFFVNVVTPHAALWTSLAAAYEVVLGLLILSKGIRVKVGQVGGILFNMALAPMWVGQVVPNLMLAAAHALLLRKDFEESFFEHIRHVLRGSS